MPDHPDDLHILVPETRRATVDRMVTRRQALIAGGGAAVGLTWWGLRDRVLRRGKKSEQKAA